jgi:hypothetical protein
MPRIATRTTPATMPAWAAFHTRDQVSATYGLVPGTLDPRTLLPRRKLRNARPPRRCEPHRLLPAHIGFCPPIATH